MSADAKPDYWHDYCGNGRHLWAEHGAVQCGVEDVTKFGEHFICDCAAKEPKQ